MFVIEFEGDFKHFYLLPFICIDWKSKGLFIAVGWLFWMVMFNNNDF